MAQTDIVNKTPPLEIVWWNVILFFYLHVATFYGIYLAIFQAKFTTVLLGYGLYMISGAGITVGVHRLWAHRSYKARWAVRVMLMFFNCMAMQNHIYEWSRDHRLHHKFSETDADPHNAKRGFFFSHMGWLMCRKHPDVKTKGKTIDMSDLMADPVVRFQKRNYPWLAILWGLLIPTALPMYLGGESAWNSFFICTILRYSALLHTAWLINSAAHRWGSKPYDKNIGPTEQKLVAAVSSGEGFHNYHHTFPWDYRCSEWGIRKNLSGSMILFWSKFGLTYDLKVVPKHIIDKRRQRTGDGSGYWWSPE